MKIKSLLIVAISWATSFSAAAQTTPVGADVKLPAHPRLLLLKGEEEGIKRTIAGDKTWAKLHQVILTESDAMLNLPPVERIKEGKRLLGKSRECLRRVFYLAYAWRLTHQEKYRKRAEQELLAVAAFSDWNSSHFLDVAEMTMGMAIGYDWLYDDLSQAARATIKEAILKKGIEPSLDAQNNSWLRNTNNWNQVCNAGISFGALATYEDHPELSRQIVNRAIETIKLPMGDYRPDGAYPEGYNYWGYGTTFNVLLISALQKSLGSDFGLSAQPGFLKTAGYLENMAGPSGMGFNYSDSRVISEMQPASAMFWYAGALRDPSLLWMERQTLEKGTAEEYVKNRLLPATMVWGGTTSLNTITPPKATMWVGQGKNPVALMRTSWTDPAAIYVGLKGGSPGLSHAHMDAGSFVMEAAGVRWAMDLGMQEYESLESKGVDLWNMKQNSQRWQVFRYNNLAHSTLAFNDSLQRVNGTATLTGSSNTPMFMNATTDLTGVYKSAVAKAVRGVAIVDKSYVVVRDEIETLPANTTVRWTMVTPATVRITGKNTAELTQDGKKLFLQVQEPAQVTMKTWPTTPPHAYDVPNPGTTLVGFEVQLPANAKTALNVLLVPEKAQKQAKQKSTSLAQWPQRDVSSSGK
ncbi:heparinase II/III domain-containing protein [Hymenobacter sp. GOD-10R]|uniref:heparinase II/III domain-containing protein n=1 Tax=Hymenobacter sp. GOD-10R TaxID=3093922 RepID=UPI002D779A5C|nr:heparinase II/III family protein [Hymenobacter sp. GOD-10R]WRQ31103.1 heparinase II/III family protein [Hymenobacter sp. GOD-10R]